MNEVVSMYYTMIYSHVYKYKEEIQSQNLQVISKNETQNPNLAWIIDEIRIEFNCNQFLCLK